MIMKKQVAALVLGATLLSALGLSGCTVNKKESYEWVRVGKEEAIEYLEEKYDTDDIKIINARSETTGNDNFQKVYTPSVIVNAEVDGKECVVYVKHSGTDNYIQDSLQKDEIIDALEDVIEARSNIDVDEIQILYGANYTIREFYLINSKFELKKKATIEDKIEALRKIFCNEAYNVNGKRSTLRCEINVLSINDSINGFEEDTNNIVYDVLGFENICYQEIAVKSQKALDKLLESDLNCFMAYRIVTLGEYINGYCSIDKSTGYMGKLKLIEYTYVEEDDFSYVLVNANPEDLNWKTSKSKEDTVKFSFRTYNIISDRYEVEIPEGAELFIYVYDKDIKVVNEYENSNPSKKYVNDIAFDYLDFDEYSYVYEVGRFAKDGKTTFYLIEK